MKLLFRAFYAFTLISLLYACKHRKDPSATNPEENPALTIYRAAVTQLNDLVHTRLEIEPDFIKKELKGTAILLLKPHFYATDSLILDAKYMRIGSVRMVKWRENYGVPQYDTTLLKYSYDSLNLRIKLDKRYTREQYYMVEVEYVAQPEKVRSRGSQAITDAKGLYFINADGKIPGKPVQLWTQGETEAAACWFPTIDAPNQKTSQEILVTVPSKYKTISNGKLEGSKDLPGNKRQDHWKQDLPHAPYLFALVVGEFAEVKDKWNGKDVNYYVEPAFEPYARMVFGNTPKMIEFFSQVLDVPYPWDKYHQVVVRDFVSGAMENTGCVVHFDKLQHNHREHLDNTFEDVVSHELFHHWFGDLVTCESWSNVPLNESFATYGEYLWDEHQYGRDEADVRLGEFHASYFGESEYKSENLIRYYYEDQEDMFDAHSYQKGGSIVHMLRKYVGDEAFFASLKLYLTRRAYKTAEIADLRLAFEDITGEDLNWFFNQWFMGNGHPNLKVFHQTYNGSGGIYGMTVVQHGKVFKLPVDVDIYTEKGVERHRIVVEKDSQTFGIPCSMKPLCVVFDAENQLLAEKEETKTIEGWESQLRYVTLSEHKIMALNQLLNVQADRQKKIAYCKTLLKDSFWNNRSIATRKLYTLGLSEEEIKPLMEQIKLMAMTDAKSDVRNETVYFFRDQKDAEQLKKMLNDSSYMVVRKSLMAIISFDKKAAFAFADRHRYEKVHRFQEAIFVAIAKSSPLDELDFFIGQVEQGDQQTARNSGNALAYYIYNNQSDKTDEAIKRLSSLANNKTSPGVRENALSAMGAMRDFYYYQLYYFNLAMKDKKNASLFKEKQKATQMVYDQLDAEITKHKLD